MRIQKTDVRDRGAHIIRDRFVFNCVSACVRQKDEDFESGKVLQAELSALDGVMSRFYLPKPQVKG